MSCQASLRIAGKAKSDWRDWECGKWCERKSYIYVLS